MTSNIPPSKCARYEWCTSRHLEPGWPHQATRDLIEHIDDSNLVVEVNLYAPADDSTPPVVRVMFTGDDGLTAYIDLPGFTAGSIAYIIRYFERPGLIDRRGLREFAELLTEGASMLSEVTEL
ncbi:hypothetical protein ACWEJ6_47550 [Nonomuraea sp. NPDC004702]